MMKRQKTKAIIIKRCKIKKKINLSSRDKNNYENNTRDDMDANQVHDKYLLQF